MLRFICLKVTSYFCLICLAVSSSFLFQESLLAENIKPLKKFDASSHVLNRLAFGPQTGQVADVTRMGWEKWVEEQLNPDSVDDSKLQEYVKKQCPLLNKTLTSLKRRSRWESKERQTAKREIKRELADAVLLRAVYSKRQFKEVILGFWRNHFNIDTNKVPFLAPDYEENVLGKHAFGRFEDLLMATAKHPAMLVYLDNYVSRRGNVNENYAREIMELHTLGVDNGYTQDDVINLARVLTGWTAGWQGAGLKEKYSHIFNERIHDTNSAKVLELNFDGRGGQADGEKAIRYLARHSNTADFIAKKLCQYLVNDEPSDLLVKNIAKVFQDTDGDLTKVYRAIIFSSEFMSPANYRVKFKTPFEYLASVLRATDARIESTKELQKTLNLMGQPTYEFLEPTGYYDQAESWLDPGVMIYRWNFALNLVRDKVEGVKIGNKFVDVVMKSQSSQSRARYVILMVMPGSKDKSTEALVSRATDIRVMVAAALGSPGFQQQ